MSAKPRWQDPDGLTTINTIVKKLVPSWTNGLHPVQLELVSAILDGEDVLCCTATGNGKSAAFAIPPIVLLEYNRSPGIYTAGLPTRTKPIGVVITPTKGLADNIVHGLSEMNVSGLSYCKETLTEARKTGVRLAGDIKECTKWQVVCVDPEHLQEKEWREITRSPVFRSNILFACIDEAHLINEWGLDFRRAFGAIGAFLRGCLPPSVSIIGLSATLEPGEPTVSVCRSLGFFEGRFKLIRQSNERPNTQFGIEFLSQGLNGDKFPFLLPYLASGRKAIIHCRTIDQVSRVYAYFWRLQPEGSDKLRRVRVYHSICPPDYNKETIRLLDDDPHLQIVISTVAFSNGLNARSLLDSLSLGFGSTFNESWQEKGRVGRDPKTVGRGVIFAHRRVIKEAHAYLSVLASVAAPPSHNNKKGSKKKAKSKNSSVLDKSKALVITEKVCHIACVNRCYGNPSLDPARPELSTLDCIAAGRRLPCNLCLDRVGGNLQEFLPSPLPPGFLPLPVLTAPQTGSKPSRAKKDRLTKKEREIAEKPLHDFGEYVRRKELYTDSNKYRPRSSYFPTHILASILDALLVIHFPADLEHILNNSWPYYLQHGSKLYDVVIEIQASINLQRSIAKEVSLAKRKGKKQQSDRAINESDNEGESHDLEPEAGPSSQVLDNDNTSNRKRQAMEPITRNAKRPRGPRSAQPSVAEVAESYGPRYKTRKSVRSLQELSSEVVDMHGSLRSSSRRTRNS
ncbi:hypothetical protein CVT26_014348 [Gymnopilus dilepis]|uniref:Helicase ATP-binding domain-containing protein n=1 Tax=Gymnopilus dilepis TaxID=231916 RepID=A0A409Y6T1_9AGAR|nr:hypothetical protein CVT26_014348 [Gymnopilus dilepis]